MPHQRTDSASSIDSYKEIEEDAKSIESGETKLDVLVGNAETLIREFSSAPPNTFSPDKGKTKIQLDKVITAMLDHSMESGGDLARRYVASCVIACDERGRGEGKEGVYSLLRDLSVTWLTHFLFIFKTSYYNIMATQASVAMSDIATPTRDETAELLTEGVQSRSGSFRENLLLRDGYKCPVSGLLDLAWPANVDGITLEAAHFLRRSVAEFKDEKSPHYRSVVTTFDILRSYTCLPDKVLNELASHIDDTSNGMLLEHNLHVAFDHFFWCLKPTEVANVYKIKQVVEDRVGCWRLIPKGLDRLKEPVVFENQSGNFLAPNSRKRARVYELPNPRFIEIHAAVAGILHMSGAGKFFDELLDRYEDRDERVDPVRCWPEFEAIVEKRLLREDLLAVFAH